jgi:hypothetical protein
MMGCPGSPHKLSGYEPCHESMDVKEEEMTVVLSPQKKAANTRARKKFLKQLKENQYFLRANPAALAAEIARKIRLDQHANENPMYYDNGVMHWYQNAWGQFKFDRSQLRQISLTGYHSNTFEVSCPTTGCIAGWTTTLAGYPMVIRAFVDEYELGDIVETALCNVNGRITEIVSVARDLLKLSDSRSAWLFQAYRTQDEVLWALDKIAAGQSWHPYDCPLDD